MAQVSTMRPAAGRLEVMPDSECVRRLKANELGRLGLVDHDVRPVIFPINYFFDEGVIAFRTGPGSKLDLAPGAPVCFEVDGWDAAAGVGWSVLAKGIAHDITHPRGSPTARMRYWPVRPMAPGARENWIGIWVTEITGRWFRSAVPSE
jgi:nitroimidazol reductase NimA-like FMN-containing flavoprotein (pyridoxamine 5'-phosphate oxidase superfamily)